METILWKIIWKRGVSVENYKFLEQFVSMGVPAQFSFLWRYQSIFTYTGFILCFHMGYNCIFPYTGDGFSPWFHLMVFFAMLVSVYGSSPWFHLIFYNDYHYKGSLKELICLAWGYQCIWTIIDLYISFAMHLNP